MATLDINQLDRSRKVLLASGILGPDPIGGYGFSDWREAAKEGSQGPNVEGGTSVLPTSKPSPKTPSIANKRKAVQKAVTQKLENFEQNNNPEATSDKIDEQRETTLKVNNVTNNVNAANPDVPANSGATSTEQSIGGDDAYTQNKFENSYDGRKWTAYLQGRGSMPTFLVPGSDTADFVLKAASQERGNSASQPNERARQMLLARHTAQYDKLLTDREYGKYDGADEEFNAAVEHIKDSMRRDGFDPSILRPVPPAWGKVNARLGKTFQENEDTFNTVEMMNDMMANAEDFDRLMESPEQTTLWDKMGELIVKQLTSDKSVLADSEKIRIQTELMTPEMKRDYNATVGDYFKALDSAARVGALSGMDYSTRSKLDEIGGYFKSGNFIAGLERMRTLNKDSMPLDLRNIIDAANSKYEAYSEWIMRNARVDRAAVWKLASYIYDKTVQRQNDLVERSGQPAKYLRSSGRIKDWTERLNDWQVRNPHEKMYRQTFPKAKAPKPSKGPGNDGEHHGRAQEKQSGGSLDIGDIVI